MYELEYLPIAKKDMVDIATYISKDLCNPTAAEQLSIKLTESAENLTIFPYKNQIHSVIKPLKQEYRKLIVDNYIMFYFINEEHEKITIARVFYARRDYDKLL